MSGAGTDYTLTPTLGLYKPIANMAVGLWGDLLNTNADAIDAAIHFASGGGPFLPLAGATVFGPTTFSGSTTFTGPLNYTATGGSVARSAQARAADVANVLDFGADPTAAADSADAFRAAIATGKSVFIPSGSYKITKQLTLTASQTLRGDGRGNTFLLIDQTFDPTASSVILCGPSADWGPTIRDLAISFSQPNDVTSRATFKTLAAGGTSVNGGTGVQYPWAIYGPSGGGRTKVQNVQVRGAWNGFLFDTVFWIDNIEMGAIGTGLAQAINNTVLDWCFVGTYEHWSYGWTGGALVNIFIDGQTIAIQCGSAANPGFQTGIMAQSIANLGGRVLFYGSGWSTITNLNHDSSTCSLEVYGHLFLEITNFYHTGGATSLQPAIAGLGSGSNIARLFIHNMYAHSSANYPLVSVTGNNSQVHISGVYVIYYTLTSPAFFVSTGILRVESGRLVGPGTGRTVPFMDQASGNLIVGDSITFSVDTGTAIRFQQDNAGNYLGMNPTASVSLPATISNGYYSRYSPLSSPTGVVKILSAKMNYNAISGQTATGSTQADALPISNFITRFTTTSAGTGALLPPGAVGDAFTIYNGGVSTLRVYGSGTNSIDSIGATIGVPLSAGKAAQFLFFGATWISAQLGVSSA